MFMCGRCESEVGEGVYEGQSGREAPKDFDQWQLSTLELLCSKCCRVVCLKHSLTTKAKKLSTLFHLSGFSMLLMMLFGLWALQVFSSKHCGTDQLIAMSLNKCYAMRSAFSKEELADYFSFLNGGTPCKALYTDAYVDPVKCDCPYHHFWNVSARACQQEYCSNASDFIGFTGYCYDSSNYRIHPQTGCPFYS